MAAQAQTPTQRRDEITFPPNTPITVSMKFAQPRLVAGKFGERYMFTTTDDARFFLDPPVAGQIAALGINVREPFSITRRESGRKGEPAQWEVARLTQPATPAPGEQPDGTYVVPRDPEAGERAAKPMARAESATGTWLVEQSIIAVDAYAEVLAHGLSAHGGKVKPEEIKSIFVTLMINRAKGAA